MTKRTLRVGRDRGLPALSGVNIGGFPGKHLATRQNLFPESRLGANFRIADNPRTFRHSYSSLLRSVGTELKVMQEL
jgi:hypothetical protein